MELRYGIARLPLEAKLPPLVEEALRNLTVVAWDSACAATCARLRAELQSRGINVSFAEMR